MADEQKLRDYLKKAAANLNDYRQRVSELEARAHQPIAIVGMACRYPGGVTGPEELWQLVQDGRDAITPFPTDRGWDLKAMGLSAEMETYGGFVDGFADFDADFFGISPREALGMDPQQRLLLESAWHALEYAALRPQDLRGSRTGVFVGSMYHSYGSDPRSVPEAAAPFLGMGTAASVISGRLSYVLGLEGPAVSIDTACSSSLVALHLAAQALRNDECDLALAGGVTIMTDPGPIADFARQGNIGSGARCKAFAQAADGTGLSEGVGILVVERLSDALAHGHDVLAVVRGTAVNQDGASNGLTAPNGPSQQRVIRAALADARLTAADVQAVEAHGTGTSLGDPIEAQALLATYGADRDEPAWLGSLKSNLGHTQAAAGVGGIIKMVMAMRHGELPRTLHVDEPSHQIDWTAGRVELLSESRPWPAGADVRRAAVSSFGISGTNAHVVIEQAPSSEPVDPPSVAAPWLLSGRSAEAVRDQARALADAVAAGTPDVGAVARTLAGRTAFDHRAAVTGPDRLAGLRAVADADPSAVAGPVSGGALGIVFTGQGAQRVGMGRELYAAYPVYRDAFDACVAAFDGLLPGRLDEVVRDGPAELLDRTLWTQPALFAVETALYRLVESWGVRARVVAGHSIGEVTAAHVAGVLTLADAARLVAARARLMDALPEGGAMLAVEATEDGVAALVAGVDGVDIAAVNAPDSVVVSGPADAVEAVAGACRRDGVRHKRLSVSHAFHSALMTPMLADFDDVLRTITFTAPHTEIVSTVTGATADHTDPGYWSQQVRGTVRFADALATVAAAGVDLVLELGPDAALSAAAARTDVVRCVPVLQRDRPELDTLAAAIGHLHVHGTPLDRPAALGAGPRAVLPGYPFQHERYWFDPIGTGDVRGAGLADANHPLLGATVAVAGTGQVLMTGHLTTRTQPWLADHVVAGLVLLPGTALLELASRAGAEVGCGRVAELIAHTPLVLDHDGVTVQVSVHPGDEGARHDVTVHARREGDDEWTLHASGQLEPAHGEPDQGEWDDLGGTPLDVAELHGRMAAAGIEYGPAFAGLHDVSVTADGAVQGEITLPVEAGAFLAHPALLDAALQTIALLPGLGDSPALPFAFTGAELHPAAHGATHARVRAVARDGGASLTVTDEHGTTLASIGLVSVRAVSSTDLAAATVARALHEVQWRPVTGAALGTDVTVAALPGGADPVAAVTALLAVVREHLDRPGGVLVLAGRGAVSTVDGEDVTDLGAAACWGLARSAQSEHPGRFVLVDTDTDLEQVRGLLATGEPQLAVRAGRTLAPRLVRRPLPEAVATEWTGPVLVTGGTGALGAHVARHLVTTHGVREIVLTSRRGPDAPGAAELADELRTHGARVDVLACDLTAPAAVRALVDEHPVRSIVHAAGVLADATVETMTDAQLHDVLAAKARSAHVLHDATLATGLARFVLFSSVAGVLGNAGQANYAAANTYVDALAAHRIAQGLPATSIAWGMWATEDGMAADADVAARIARTGVAPLSVEQGLTLFDLSVASGSALVVPVDLDLPREADAATLPSMLRALVQPVTARVSTAAVDELLRAPEGQRARLALRIVRDAVAVVLGSDPDSVAADRPFGELGFTSLTAVELRNRLGAVTGLGLPPTLIFDHPTSEAVAELLLRELDERAPAAVAAAPSPGRTDEHDPIVVVGMACRYPGGVDSPDALWQLVLDARDAVGEFPTDRGWDLENLYHPDPDHPGTSYTRNGGFLTGAGEFDARFFGISPREAVAMDPQQRLLLETTWEAIESAGIDAATLRGSRTGVFAGAMYHDYASQLGAVPDGVAGFLSTGTSGSVIAGRVSYVFGLEGPALSIDTACSSSLVAVHQAASALRSGECELALAGGVTVMATPTSFVEFSRQRGLAADGRCRAFSADAGGTGWGEGVGMLLLERQSDAVRHGHEVLAVVRGSAVNQDGASNGLTAPNGPSQQRVIRAALDDAGLQVADVDVIEAHGTGTSLGDPIEAQAVLATYGQDRSTPVLLGSLKSNISHTQAAAGVGGMIKMIQAMRYGTVPATLHAGTSSPHVDWTAGQVDLVTTTRPWPETGHPRRAGVSSFGFSGTNAHVVLEQAPAVETPVVPTSALADALPWLVSAKTAAGLRAQAGKLLDHFGLGDDVDLAAVGRTLATRRTALPARAAVFGATVEDRMSALGRLVAGRDDAAVLTGERRSGGLGVVFTGQGSQRAGMGRSLYDNFPVYAAAFDAVCEAFGDVPVRDVVFGEDDGRLDRTEFTQPALFAHETALYRLVQSFGVTPSAVAGHSIGEVVAAHVAGVLTLTDAATLVTARARLMGALPAGGGMAAVNAAESTVLGYLDGTGLDVAAVNSPTSTVVSGDLAAIEALVAWLTADGVRCKQLTVSHAFHSRLMDPMLAEFEAAIAGLTFNAPSIPVVSDVTGTIASGDQLVTPSYWAQHVRAAVRFADTVTTLAADCAQLLEIGPDAVLTAMAAETTDCPAVAAQRRDRDETEALVAALSVLWVGGARLDWSSITATAGETALPTYAFQRKHYWLASVPLTARPDAEESFWREVQDGDANALAERLNLSADAAAGLLALLPELGAWHTSRADDGPPDAYLALPEDDADDELASLTEQLADLDPDERAEVLCEIVLTQVGIVLGHVDSSELEAAGDLLDLGFTSLTAVELRNRLEVITGLELPAALVYEFSSVREIAEFAADELAPASAS